MSSPSPSNLAGLKAQADFAASMARLEFKHWLALHRRHFCHRICEATWAFACASIAHNVKRLQACRTKPIREYIQVVLKVQREIKKSEKTMREWERKEKRAHGAYVQMAGYVQT
jgi:DNA-binding transcriptional regulator YiaG